MSSGYHRPHSSDSWAARRSVEFLSRMQSLPRNTKLKTSSAGFTPDYGYMESPTYYVYRNPVGVNIESSSTRKSVRPFERATMSTKLPQIHLNQELKRKMVFALHEEIKKPALTITLEEISDIERITSICLETLTAMMKSKIYRKYLHHMNSTDFLNLEHLTNSTSNNNKSGQENNIQIEDPSIEEDTRSRGSSRKSEPRSKAGSNNSDIASSSKPKINHLKAIKNLKEKLPKKKCSVFKTIVDSGIEKSPLNPSTKKIAMKHLALINQLHVSEERKSTMEKGFLTASSGHNSPPPSGPAMHPVVHHPEVESDDIQPRRTHLMTAEEILKCKWLRLNDTQIARLEDEIRSTGRNPGIHNHAKINYDDYFGD